VARSFDASIDTAFVGRLLSYRPMPDARYSSTDSTKKLISRVRDARDCNDNVYRASRFNARCHDAFRDAISTLCAFRSVDTSGAVLDLKF